MGAFQGSSRSGKLDDGIEVFNVEGAGGTLGLSQLVSNGSGDPYQLMMTGLVMLGAIEGVAGPEAANNASFSGTLVPLLTLGIPTSATAAIMLAAFQIFNLQPGPELFERNSELVWTLIASL